MVDKKYSKSKRNFNGAVFKRVFCAALIVCCFSALFNAPFTASANSAAPIPSDGTSGIVFDKHGSVKIESEVLDIVMRGNTADVTATYKMANDSDAPVSVNAMFLSPVVEGESKDFTVWRNGESLETTSEFFSSGDYYYGGNSRVFGKLADWEEVLERVKTPTKPFGDGKGFFRYTVSPLNNGIFSAEFTVNGYFFASGWHGMEENGNTVKISGDSRYSGNAVIEILTRKSLPVTPENASVKVDEIDDIYDDIYEYLFIKGIENYRKDSAFAVNFFNEYLYELSQKTLGGYTEMFYFSNGEEYYYVNAVRYTVDFGARETVELKVSYSYNLGSYSNGYYKMFDYYLTPAKYWKDFKDLTINLTLSETHPRISHSSLKFKKIDDGVYQYKSSELPDGELSITVKEKLTWDNWKKVISPYFILAIIIFAIVLPAIGITIIVSIVVHFVRKKRRIAP